MVLQMDSVYVDFSHTVFVLKYVALHDPVQAQYQSLVFFHRIEKSQNYREN